MKNLINLPLGPHVPERVNAVIEIPRGVRTKYEYRSGDTVFALDRVLYSSMFYPFPYGFFPQTRAEDGDPLDVLVMISVPLHTGIMLEVRPVGMLRLRDEHGVDNKILAVASHEASFRELQDLDQVSEDELRLIEHFFLSYKTLERKQVESMGWADRDSALGSILAAQANYRKL